MPQLTARQEAYYRDTPDEDLGYQGLIVKDIVNGKATWEQVSPEIKRIFMTPEEIAADSHFDGTDIPYDD